MCNSSKVDFDANPVGWTPNAENLGAFHPIISSISLELDLRY
jgi:hypothetical protein